MYGVAYYVWDSVLHALLRTLVYPTTINTLHYTGLTQTDNYCLRFMLLFEKMRATLLK